MPPEDRSETFEFDAEDRGFEDLRTFSNEEGVGRTVFKGGQKKTAGGETVEERLQVRSGRGDKFHAQLIEVGDEGKIVDKQTIGRPRRSQEDAREALERFAETETAAGFGGFEIGDFVVDSESETDIARRVHRDRSDRARSVDQQQRAPVTTSAQRYASAPGELDYPGVDTPKTDPRVLPKDLKQPQQPQTTNPKDDIQHDEKEFFRRVGGEKLPASEFATSPEGERKAKDARRAQRELAERNVTASSGEVFRGVAAGSVRMIGGFRPGEGEFDRPEREQVPPDIQRGVDPAKAGPSAEAERAEDIKFVFESTETDRSLSQFKAMAERKQSEMANMVDEFGAASLVADELRGDD